MGSQTSCWLKKPTKMSVRMATKPPVFDDTDKNAVIGVGAPSYVSGAHVWNGTADTLNAKPTTENTMPSVTMGFVPVAAKLAEMSRSTVVPVTPKINDIP